MTLNRFKTFNSYFSDFEQVNQITSYFAIFEQVKNTNYNKH